MRSLTEYGANTGAKLRFLAVFHVFDAGSQRIGRFCPPNVLGLPHFRHDPYLPVLEKAKGRFEYGDQQDNVSAADEENQFGQYHFLDRAGGGFGRAQGRATVPGPKPT